MTSPSPVSQRIVREPSQARPRETLRQIIAADQAVLLKDGESGFTMAKVASEARLSAGVLYSNFASKSQLILAVKDLLIDNVESFSQAMASPFASLEVAIQTCCSTMAGIFDRGGPSCRS